MNDDASANMGYAYSKLRLRERDIAPTDEALMQTLGATVYASYEAFQDVLPRLSLEQEWQWYTPHKAWFGRGWHWWTTPRGVRKEKTLYWLHVYESSFNVAVWFLEKNRAEAMRENVSEKTKQLIAGSKTFGKVPTFPVVFEITGGEPLNDIYTLIECKKRLER